MTLRPGVQFLFHLRSHTTACSFIKVKTLARTILYKLLDLFDFAIKCPLSHSPAKLHLGAQLKGPKLGGRGHLDMADGDVLCFDFPKRRRGTGSSTAT